MGFSLGSSLVNIFVEFNETKLFSNANKPHTYHRYVYDTYAAFSSEKECEDFFILFNSLHPIRLRKSVMVLFLFGMFCLRKVKLNLLLRFTESRQLQVNICYGTSIANLSGKLI